MKRILLLAAMTVAFVGAASAQYSTRGFFVRPHLVGAAWRLDDFEEDAEAGGGLGLALGYGFNERVAAYLEFSGASIDPDTGNDYGLGHFDLGALFTVGSFASRLKGNFMVALNGRAAELDQPGADIEASGAGLTLGGGVLYFTSPNLALDLNLLFTVGEISEVKVNGLTWNTNLDATSTRLNVGVAWFPGR